MRPGQIFVTLAASYHCTLAKNSCSSINMKVCSESSDSLVKDTFEDCALGQGNRHRPARTAGSPKRLGNNEYHLSLYILIYLTTSYDSTPHPHLTLFEIYFVCGGFYNRDSRWAQNNIWKIYSLEVSGTIVSSLDALLHFHFQTLVKSSLTLALQQAGIPFFTVLRAREICV